MRPRCAQGCVHTAYDYALDAHRGIHLFVEFHTRGTEVTDYAIVLALRVGGRPCVVRVYDGAHGLNEMHRCTMTMGKRDAAIFHRGTLGEGMRIALEQVKRGYEEMIAAWRQA